jgi:hypothetical protein
VFLFHPITVHLMLENRWNIGARVGCKRIIIESVHIVENSMRSILTDVYSFAFLYRYVYIFDYNYYLFHKKCPTHVQPCPKRFQISDNSFIPGIYLYARMIDMLGHIRVKNGVYIALDRVFSLIAHPRVMCKFLNMFCSIYI